MVDQSSMTFESHLHPVQEAMHDFEIEFEKTFDQDIRMIKPILDYAGHTEGKRLRPILFFLTQGMIGAPQIRHTVVAVMIEMLHSVSLMHDDVIDEADIRRGEATMNATWGNKLAVLAGDYLLAKMLSIGINQGYGDVLKRIADVAVEMGRGELMQGVLSSHPELTINDYYSIIEKKTAMLFGVASELAGRVVDKNQDEMKILYQLGLNFGMSFQIKDDILDLIGTDDVMGKPTGQDLLNGKLNIPIVLALSKADEKARHQLLNMLKQKETIEYKEIQNHLDIEKGIQMAETAALDYTDKTKSIVQLFDESPYKTSIISLLQFNLDRVR